MNSAAYAMFYFSRKPKKRLHSEMRAFDIVTGKVKFQPQGLRHYEPFNFTQRGWYYDLYSGDRFNPGELIYTDKAVKHMILATGVWK